MSKVLVFDIWGDYAHYKKIYATTSAISYIIPSKTSLYGYIGAVVGLEKTDNDYLNHFKPGQCQIALQLLKSVKMQRVNTNLRGTLGRVKNGERKPTTIEYVYKPKYRVYFKHTNDVLFDKLAVHLKEHTAVYTPTLGLAYLLSNFKWIAEIQSSPPITETAKAIPIDSIIPRSQFIDFDLPKDNKNEIIEYSQYALEMDTERNVLEREDVFVDRKGQSITAFVKSYTPITINDSKHNIIFF